MQRNIAINTASSNTAPSDRPDPSTDRSRRPSPATSNRTPVYWNEHFLASRYAFDTTRKSALVVDQIKEEDLNVELVDPATFADETERLIGAVHDGAYVEAVRTGEPLDRAESQGFSWDEGIYPMALAHNSGLVAAVHDVLSGRVKVAGSLSSGLHHARAREGRGYCTFNGLAVAARAALDEGANRILILDFDAHGGGGTRSLLAPDQVTQIDVSTNPFDRWTPEGSDSYRLVDADDYLPAISDALDRAEETGPFDLVLYNAGMDPVTDSGVSPTTITHRESQVARWATARGWPLVYTLAGGYEHGRYRLDDVATLHTLTVKAFA